MKGSIRILLALVLVVPALLASPASVSAFGIYTDKSNWASDVGEPYFAENFADATLNPEISVFSDNGYVTGGLWWDRVDDGDWGDYGTTTWTFSVPMYAWGGTFDLYGPGGPGSSIKVTYLDGSSGVVGIIPNYTAGTFWGFILNKPFNQVHLEDAKNIVYACETYTMDDMVYAVLDNYVTGGGTVGKGKDLLWSFGGNIGVALDATLVGQFNMVDHVGKVAYHTAEITALFFSGDPATTPAASHNTVTFTANFRGNDGSTKVVTVTIQDLGEKSPKIDTIELRDDLTLAQTALSGGNLQVHDVD